jgi:integration host factor subunit beta
MIKKSALIQKINKIAGVTLRDASVCIDVIFDAMSEAISRGERIELRGFGSFSIKNVSQKNYPSSFSSQTLIPSHGRIVFRPCQKLRLSVWNRVKK